MRTLIGLLMMGALSVSLPASADEHEEMAQAQTGCEPIRLYFKFDSTKLDEAQKQALDRAAQCLKENQSLRVFVEGNTDPIGSIEYNQALGADRSASVAEYLKAQGVSASQLQQISFGEGKPVCSEDDESCYQKNRNAEIRPACKL